MAQNPSSGIQNRFEKHPRLTILAVVVLFILIVDLAAGIIFIPEQYPDFRRAHPIYHHGFYPSVSSVTTWGKSTYPVYTNSMEMVDSSPRVVKPEKGKKRILLIGDSFTEGIGVPYKSSFAGHLARWGDSLGIEVLNAGALSYSPKLYYLKTKHLIEQGLEMDELWVFIDISDIQDEIFYKEFEPRENVPAQQEKNTFDLTSFSYIWYSITVHLLDKNLATKANSVPVESNVWFEQLNKELWNNPHFYEERSRWTFDTNIYNKWGKEGLSLARDNMYQLVDLCNANQIQMKLLVYPWPDQIHMGHTKNIHVNFWEAFAKQEKLDFVNIFPLFVVQKKETKVIKNWFIEGDVHWNEKGHLELARFLKPHLTK